MSSFKCTFCDRTFDSLTGLTLHTNKCPLSAGDINKNLTFSKTTESFRNTLNLFKSTENIKKKNFDNNFSKNIEISSIRFRKKSKSFESLNEKKEHNFQANNNFNMEIDNYLTNSEINDDNNIAECSYINSQSTYTNIIDDSNIAECSYISSASTNLDSCSSFAQCFAEFQSDSESDDFNQTSNKFPNDAYADLMILVTKYKLSNAAGNAIISFFNKHSNLPISLLPKNIKQEKLFMNNMKSNLDYQKTCVLKHNDKEYFLYHIPLISCIKNILEISDILQYFALDYQELYKNTEV